MAKTARAVAPESLLERIIFVLRTTAEPYHREYPRLLSEQHSLKSIAEILERDIDIVEMHVERFYARVPGLAKLPLQERVPLLKKAWQEFVRFGPLPLLRIQAVLAEEAEARAKAAARPTVRKTPKPTVTPDPKPPEKRARASGIFETISPEEAATRFGLVFPDAETILERMKSLNGSDRRTLEAMVSYDSLPSREELAAKIGFQENSLQAREGYIFGTLGVSLPAGYRRVRALHDYRFRYLKDICTTRTLPPVPVGRKTCT